MFLEGGPIVSQFTIKVEGYYPQPIAYNPLREKKIISSRKILQKKKKKVQPIRFSLLISSWHKI